MFTRKAKLTSAAFVLVLALSGASYGFLLGRSQQLKASAEETTEQLQSMGGKVQQTGAVLHKGLDVVQRMLVK